MVAVLKVSKVFKLDSRDEGNFCDRCSNLFQKSHRSVGCKVVSDSKSCRLLSRVRFKRLTIQKHVNSKVLSFPSHVRFKIVSCRTGTRFRPKVVFVFPKQSVLLFDVFE